MLSAGSIPSNTQAADSDGLGSEGEIAGHVKSGLIDWLATSWLYAWNTANWGPPIDNFWTSGNPANPDFSWSWANGNKNVPSDPVVSLPLNKNPYWGPSTVTWLAVTIWTASWFWPIDGVLVFWMLAPSKTILISPDVPEPP